MRTWEIVLLATVTAAALALCAGRLRRGRVGLVLCAAAVAAAGTQLIVEGPRWQVVPAYVGAGAAMAVLAWSRWRARPTPPPQAGPRLGRTFLRAIGATGLLTALAAAWAVPIASPVFVPMPTTGAWKVGTVSFEIAGDSPLAAQAWYPSDTDGPPAPYAAHADVLAEGVGRGLGMPAMLFNTLGISRGTAAEGVRPAPGRHPVVLFSHGMGGFRGQSSFLVEELASHGYVVLAVDYPGGAAASVTSQGTELLRTPMPSGFPQLDALMPSWTGHATRALDSLAELDRGDTALAGALDLGRIAAVGHSYGGAMSYQLLATDPRVTVAVDLDGVPYGPVHPPIDKPFLLVHASQSVDKSQYDAKLAAAGITDRAPYERTWRMQQERYATATGATGGAVTIEGADHLTFTDFPGFSPLLGGGDARDAQVQVRATVLDFLRDEL